MDIQIAFIWEVSIFEDELSVKFLNLGTFRDTWRFPHQFCVVFLASLL